MEIVVSARSSGKTYHWQLYSSVSVVTRLRAEWSGFDSREGRGSFLFATYSILALGSNQVSYPMGTWGLFPRG